jgi:hypothetical protein
MRAQSWAEHCGEEKNLLSLPGIGPIILLKVFMLVKIRAYLEEECSIYQITLLHSFKRHNMSLRFLFQRNEGKYKG